MQDLIEEKPILTHFVELANAKIVSTQPDNEQEHLNFLKRKIQLGDYLIDSMAIAKCLYPEFEITVE